MSRSRRTCKRRNGNTNERYCRRRGTMPDAMLVTGRVPPGRFGARRSSSAARRPVAGGGHQRGQEQEHWHQCAPGRPHDSRRLAGYPPDARRVRAGCRRRPARARSALLRTHRPRLRSCKPVSTDQSSPSTIRPRRVARIECDGSCGTDGVSTCCACPRLRYGPSGDTPSAPRLRWQLMGLAARPGRGVPAVHDATGRGGPPDSGHTGPEPPSRGRSRSSICIRRFFEGQFSVSPGEKLDRSTYGSAREVLP